MRRAVRQVAVCLAAGLVASILVAWGSAILEPRPGVASLIAATNYRTQGVWVYRARGYSEATVRQISPLEPLREVIGPIRDVALPPGIGWDDVDAAAERTTVVVAGWPLRCMKGSVSTGAGGLVASWGVPASRLQPRVRRAAEQRVYPLRPMPLGLAANSIGYGLACASLLWLNRGLRRGLIDAPRLRSGRCRECGYDLSGNPAPVCPECGSGRNPAA